MLNLSAMTMIRLATVDSTKSTTGSYGVQVYSALQYAYIVFGNAHCCMHYMLIKGLSILSHCSRILVFMTPSGSFWLPNSDSVLHSAG